MSIQAGSLTLTDPSSAPTYSDGPLSRWCKVHLFDPRDEVFVRLSLSMLVRMSLVMGGLCVALYVLHLPVLATGAVYLALWGWMVPSIILMLHNTMHRPLVRNPRWLNRAQTYVMAFLFGVPPAYPEHHLGMHHVEDNVGEDLSATIRYRRDSFLHFLVYFFRFVLCSHVELSMYLHRHGRDRMMRRMLVGEIGQLVFIIAVCWYLPAFGWIALAVPTIIVRFMMMAGNWGQHAFINTARANNGLTNSITCINSAYNHRCFNDGYHIGHHLKANRHWTEMPKDFADNRETYAAAGALVFEKIDFFLVSVLLWTGQWKLLARFYVPLDGVARSNDQVVEMLKSRVHPVGEWKASLAQVA